MNKISSQDRKALIRLASSLPTGSEERKAILSTLHKTSTKKASVNKLIRGDTPHTFTRGDWNTWSGASAWEDGSGYIIHDPWIMDVTIYGTLAETQEFLIPSTMLVTLIAGSDGLYIDVLSDDKDTQEHFSDSEKMDPKDGPGALKMVLRSLLSGKIPPGFK